MKVLDLLDNVNSTSSIVQSNKNVTHFIDSTSQSMLKSQAENKVNEVNGLVNEAN